MSEEENTQREKFNLNGTDYYVDELDEVGQFMLKEAVKASNEKREGEEKFKSAFEREKYFTQMLSEKLEANTEESTEDTSE